MGEFSMTCCISGLAIDGGTAVRCLLLTASPYGNDDPRRTWIVRTPPLRAVYDSYGSIENVHEDDTFIAHLWLRGIREDLIEKGPGDNSYHDTPTSKEMSFDGLLDAIRNGRVEVRQDAKHFWRRPVDVDDLYDDETKARIAASPDRKRIEGVLTEGKLSISERIAHAQYELPEKTEISEEKFVVDEPVPGLVRVRYGRYQTGATHLVALHAAREVVERAGFAGVVTAGSGRYADAADLLVFAAPNDNHVRGPQWDMATGQANDDGKHLRVAMAMVREDVWQALVRYPHSEPVSLLCTNCGQQSSYHAKDRRCPKESINDKPYKEHAADARYEHGPVFPDGVEHVVVPRDFGETVWFDVDAFKDGARETWSAIQDHFNGKPRKRSRKPRDQASHDKAIEGIMQSFANAREEERKRVAALPPDERARFEAEQNARYVAWETKERDRKDNPRFGDFLIGDLIVTDPHRPGAWLFRDTVPGVIGVSEHLSMCLSDKLEVPISVIDSLAELSAISRVMHGVGVIWKPATSTGPQYPEWDEHIRFARTLVSIAQTERHEEHERQRKFNNTDDGDAARDVASTLGEVARAAKAGRTQ